MKEVLFYLVTLVDSETGKHQCITVQSDCEHHMQEFVDTLTTLELEHPVVVSIQKQDTAAILEQLTQI